MLPNHNERLVLNIGSAVTVVPNDDPRRAGISVGATGSLAIAAAHVAVVLDMSVSDWIALAEVASAVARALAQREAALAPVATLAMAEAAGHA
jgi:type IV secretory pathway TrbD component